MLVAIGLLLVVILNFWSPSWGSRGKSLVFLIGLLSWFATLRVYRSSGTKFREIDMALVAKTAILAVVDFCLLYFFWRGQGVMILLLLVLVSAVWIRVPCGKRFSWDDLNLLLFAQIGILAFHSAKLMLPGLWLGPRGAVILLAFLLTSLLGIRTYRLKAIKLDEISLMLIVQVGWIAKFLLFTAGHGIG